MKFIFLPRRHIWVGHCQLQALIFQCNGEYNENMDFNSDCYYYIVRMCETFSQPNDCQICAIFHAILILPINIFTLLCMVGLCQLLQRRLLQPMEPSNVFYGKYFPIECILSYMRLTYLLIKWSSAYSFFSKLFTKLFSQFKAFYRKCFYSFNQK